MSLAPGLRLRWIWVLLAAGFVPAGCGLFSPTTSFLIRVDNVSVVGEAVAGGELTVRFQGVVGSDGCSRLVRVVKNVQVLNAEFGFEGERSGGYCTQMPVLLDHEELVPTPTAGTFQIRVRQPNGTVLTHPVLVQ